MARNLEDQLAKLEVNIRPWIDDENPPPYVDKDIAALDQFIRRNCGVQSAQDSPVVRKAFLFLRLLQDWDFYWRLAHPDFPGIVRITKTGLPYLHHPTPDDKDDSGGRPYLISGGAFEMNRRRH